MVLPKMILITKAENIVDELQCTFSRWDNSNQLGLACLIRRMVLTAVATAAAETPV